MSIVAVHGPQTFGSKGVVDTGPLMANVNATNGLKWDFRLDIATTRSNQDFNWTFPPDGTPTPQAVADPSEVTYAAVGTGTKTAQCVVTNTVKATINNKALTSNVATIAFSAAHGFIVGQSITITGAIGAPFLGTFVIASVPTGTTLTFPCVGADVTSGATTGTATSASTQYPAAGTYTVDVPVATGAGPSAGLLSAEEPPPEEGAYDPGDHTVDEVKDYVMAHPDEAQAIYDAEVADKNRVTLIDWFEEQ